MVARLAHTLIFAAAHPRLAAFYAAVLEWPRTEPAEGFTIVGAPPAAGIAVHQAPPHALSAPPADAPLAWREDVALKPCFHVDDLDASCAAVEAHGGATKPAWRWAGRRYVECADPEGNVFQLSAPAAP